MAENSAGGPNLGEEFDSERPWAEGVLFGTAKKAVASSVKALLSSDEGIKALIGALVPREAGQAILRELGELRSDVVAAIADELRNFMERLDLAGEVQKVLDGLDLDVNVKVRISRRETQQPARTSSSGKSTKKKARSRKKASVETDSAAAEGS